MSKRKAHLAGERCGSSYGADPARTMTPEQYQHLHAAARCGSCDKKLASLMEKARGMCGASRGACGIPCEPCEGKPDPEWVGSKDFAQSPRQVAHSLEAQSDNGSPSSYRAEPSDPDLNPDLSASASPATKEQQ